MSAEPEALDQRHGAGRTLVRVSRVGLDSDAGVQREPGRSRDTLAPQEVSGDTVIGVKTGNPRDEDFDPSRSVQPTRRNTGGFVPERYAPSWNSMWK